MAVTRRKRLPTDFFDRLLSNQTDDQINDLLTSLVDEQIAPTPASIPDETANLPAPPPAKRRAKEFHHDKIEDAIVTRDETLDEELPAPSDDAAADELIPRSARMQATGVKPEAPAPKPAPARPEPPRTPVPEAPRPLRPPAPPLPGAESLVVPPELLAEPEETGAPSDLGLPTIDLTATIPEAPPNARLAADWAPAQAAASPPVAEPVAPPALEDEPVSRVTSAPAPGIHGAPAQAARPPAPPARPAEPRGIPPAPAQAPEPEPEPAAPLLPLPSHEQLRAARKRSRWQVPMHRKPKVPKLAKFTPPISFPPRPVSDLERMFGQARERVPISFGRVQRAALMFLLPAFLAFSLFSWYPMLKGLMISLFAYAPAGVSSFIGLDNYARAFHDPRFWRTLLNAGTFCALSLLLGFWVPILISIFLNELRWGKGVLKFLFFLPFLMPTVPAAILWKWLMDQGFGLVNALIALLPVANPHIGWLTDPRLAMLSIVLLYLWKNTGWAVLIYSAALSNLDETLYEEADIDGASTRQKIWHVTLPAMRTVISVMLILTVINTLQIFTEVYILTGGGPMNSTEVIATFIYKQAFFHMDLGYAAALSILLLLMLLLITSFRLRRISPEEA